MQRWLVRAAHPRERALRSAHPGDAANDERHLVITLAAPLPRQTGAHDVREVEANSSEAHQPPLPQQQAHKATIARPARRRRWRWWRSRRAKQRLRFARSGSRRRHERLKADCVTVLTWLPPTRTFERSCTARHFVGWGSYAVVSPVLGGLLYLCQPRDCSVVPSVLHASKHL